MRATNEMMSTSLKVCKESVEAMRALGIDGAHFVYRDNLNLYVVELAHFDAACVAKMADKGAKPITTLARAKSEARKDARRGVWAPPQASEEIRMQYATTHEYCAKMFHVTDAGA